MKYRWEKKGNLKGIKTKHKNSLSESFFLVNFINLLKNIMFFLQLSLNLSKGIEKKLILKDFSALIQEEKCFLLNFFVFIDLFTKLADIYREISFKELKEMFL